MTDFPLIDEDFQQQWGQLWEEHYTEVYHHFQEAFFSADQGDNSNIDNSKSMVANYDISEHLRLLKLSEEESLNYQDIIVMCDESGNLTTSCVEETRGQSNISEDGNPPLSEKVENTTCDSDEDSFVSASSEIEFNYKDAR